MKDSTGSNSATVEVIRCRFAVIGSGIAGLWTALHLAPRGSVAVITKSTLRESNTQYAQGGIAVALPHTDSPQMHKEDTLEAGDGLCDEPAVQILTEQGPDVVRELIERGAQFDRENGELRYGREAAHGTSRILHSHGDATGAEVERTAADAVAELPAVQMYEETAAAELLIVDGQCVGVEALAVRTGQRRRFLADTTLVATGGGGCLYKYSTNPPVATADGIGLAFRAGATLQDLEFVQFHPTALADAGYPKFLISEAVRGEGAVLVNGQGEAFMAQYHALKDLAPRDVVARAVFREMAAADNGEVYLDFGPIGPGMEQRFPGIMAELHRRDFQPEKEPIPVTPAAHYMMGGIATRVDGHTGVARLFACGECASYGVHGANRLASNSILDGLVFGKLSAQAMGEVEPLPPDLQQRASRLPTSPLTAAPPQLKEEIASLMWQQVGIIRDGGHLQEADAQLHEWLGQIHGQISPSLEALEAANMCQAGWLIAQAALHREESRGAHYRVDFPRRTQQWRKHVLLQPSAPDRIAISERPVAT